MSCSFLLRRSSVVALAALLVVATAIVAAAQPASEHAPPAPAAAAQPAPEHQGAAPATSPADAGSHAATDRAGSHGSPSAAAEQPVATAAGEHGEQAHGEAAAHGESVWSFLSRIANFLILAGGLWYLLRSPFGRYLEARAQQIRSGLTTAAALRSEASMRLADIEARVKTLPGEIEALKKRGADEIAAEEVRIRQAAEAERVRLVENARREIDLQLQAARRDLTQYAGDLAVDLAEQRIKAQITGADQQRLINRYVTQMRAVNE